MAYYKWKETWNQVVIITLCCNMNFCDGEFESDTMVNIDFLLNSFCSVQTSYVVWLCSKNWVEKVQIFTTFGCTNIVWRKCHTSSASSSTTKHHFSNFLPRLLTLHNKEGTSSTECDIWKSVVFSSCIRLHSAFSNSILCLSFSLELVALVYKISLLLLKLNLTV